MCERASFGIINIFTVKNINSLCWKWDFKLFYINFVNIINKRLINNVFSLEKWGYICRGHPIPQKWGRISPFTPPPPPDLRQCLAVRSWAYRRKTCHDGACWFHSGPYCATLAPGEGGGGALPFAAVPDAREKGGYPNRVWARNARYAKRVSKLRKNREKGNPNRYDQSSSHANDAIIPGKGR